MTEYNRLRETAEIKYFMYLVANAPGSNIVEPTAVRSCWRRKEGQISGAKLLQNLKLVVLKYYKP